MLTASIISPEGCHLNNKQMWHVQFELHLPDERICLLTRGLWWHKDSEFWLERKMVTVVGCESLSYHSVQSICGNCNESNAKIFKVFTAAKVWIFIFWVVTRYFTLKTEVIRLFETMVGLTTYETTRRHNPGDLSSRATSCIVKHSKSSFIRQLIYRQGRSSGIFPQSPL
jgi:hypothetical protein